MGKSSKSIRLALLGSALILPGCQDREEEFAPVADTADDFGADPDAGGYYGPEGEAVAGGGQQGTSNGVVHHRSGGAGIAGAIIGSQVARSMMRGGGGMAPSPPSAPRSAPAAPSARGGFGATGAGFGASS